MELEAPRRYFPFTVVFPSSRFEQVAKQKRSDAMGRMVVVVVVVAVVAVAVAVVVECIVVNNNYCWPP